MYPDRDELIENASSIRNGVEIRGYDSLNLRNGSNNDVIEARKFPQYLAAVSATMSALAAGIVLGWTSPITLDIENGRYLDIPVNSTEMGWIGSLTTLGAAFMCIPTGFICDLIGRRLALLLLIVPFSIGWSLLIWANSLMMLYVGRFVTGMAVGACCVAAPLYASEIAQKEIRGALGSYFQLMVTVGVFYAYLVGKYLEPLAYTITCAIVSLIFFAVFVCQPETPLFYLKKGKFDKAKVALTRLRGKDYNVDSELSDLDTALKDATFSNVSFCYTLKKKSTRKALLISFGLMFFQQLGGINAVIFYTGDIFQASGVKVDPKIATIIVGGVQALATFVSTLVVDKLGRRVLLLNSALIMALSSFVLGIFFSLKDRHLITVNTVSDLGFLPLLSLCIFVIVFSLGFGPIPWMISSEIFISEVKSIASSVAGTFNWLLAFLVTKFYLDLQNAIGTDSTFYIFGFISVFGTLFVYFVVPETKGKSLDEIQDLLDE